MASSKKYLSFIFEQRSDLDEITYKSMMGKGNHYAVFIATSAVSNPFDTVFLCTKSADFEDQYAKKVLREKIGGC